MCCFAHWLECRLHGFKHDVKHELLLLLILLLLFGQKESCCALRRMVRVFCCRKAEHCSAVSEVETCIH